jgi:predicted helicase
LELQKNYAFNSDYVIQGSYRPFCKQNIYFTKDFNEYVYQLPKLFPNKEVSNIIICISSSGSNTGLSLLISDSVSDAHFNGDTQCFPLYYYEEEKIQSPTLFDGAKETALTRRDGVSDYILGLARKAYGERVTKEDIFYYVYGFLHCPEYRAQFSSDLKKMLPRIPLVDTVGEFWAFSKAGRKLADLHIHYETVAPYPDVTVTGAENGRYHVEKMRFPKKDQKDTIHYNSSITISNIPAEAYDYIVNGKSAIEWIMERYQITVHKDSQIKNDPNDWADEVGNPRYILDLLLSIINVSVQTVQIVKNLPTMKF